MATGLAAREPGRAKPENPGLRGSTSLTGPKMILQNFHWPKWAYNKNLFYGLGRAKPEK